MQMLNPEKATGIDTIPTKLIKVAVEFLTPLLTKSINSSIEHNIFPDIFPTFLAKNALIVSLDKRKPNKNDIANFRPVSILNPFLKIYERVIKNQLLHGMENVFSPQMPAYRKSSNSQHVLIRLIEEWREYLYKDFAVFVVIGSEQLSLTIAVCSTIHRVALRITTLVPWKYFYHYQQF